MSKTALITGGSSGIGSSIVDVLKTNNWDVITPSRAELDLSDNTSIQKYINKLIHDDVVLNAFIHVAGLWHTDDKLLANMKFSDFSEKEITDTINVGVLSAMQLINGLYAQLEDATVVGISGTFSGVAEGWLPYFVSKRALEDFLIGLAQDDKELRVFGLSPSDTKTAVYQKYFPEEADAAQTPEVVAAKLYELLTDKETYESGTILKVQDGKLSEGYNA